MNFSIKLSTCVSLTVFSFPAVLLHFIKEKKKKKKGDQAKWSDLISQQTADKSTPPSAKGPRGLGEWRCIAHFRPTTWQVPGSLGFVRSKRETKHHLWNRFLIDCCSHYRVEVLKLFTVYRKKHWMLGERDMKLMKLCRAKPFSSCAAGN